MIDLRRPHVCHCGNHAFVGLTRGQVALISPEDAPLIGLHTWRATPRAGGRYYAFRTKDQNSGVYMHRAILGEQATRETDHQNHDTLDNRRPNLAPSNHQANQSNRRKNKPGLFPYKGVRRVGRRYYARVRFNYVDQHVPGGFSTPREAAIAYDQLAIACFGPGAATNKSLGYLE